MKILVDASRNRSGGSIEYLLGVFCSKSVNEFDGEIHLWAPREILYLLPDNSSTVIKRSSWMIESNIVIQFFWQAIILPIILKTEKFDLLFSTDASTVTFFKKHAVMSQDMLSYEQNIMSLYPVGFHKLRLHAIYYLQNFAFKRAKGIVFLTKYASQIIQKQCGKVANFTVIPHGVDAQDKTIAVQCMSKNKVIRLVYVSNAAPYKNQWHVIEALKNVRGQGYNVELLLIGGGNGPAQEKTQAAMNLVDPNGDFIIQTGFLDRKAVQHLVSNSDIYIFASSCENLPITLLEGMALGLPIASSNRGPMPEVLLDGGEYFDPEKPKSIARAIVSLIENDEGRINKQEISYLLSKRYSWEKTAQDTLNYLKSLY